MSSIFSKKMEEFFSTKEFFFRLYLARFFAVDFLQYLRAEKGAKECRGVDNEHSATNVWEYIIYAAPRRNRRA